MFVGRDKEIAAALNMFNEGKRIIHITGEAGVGKSIFAEELAKRIFDNYYHFYIDPEILQKAQKIACRRRKEIDPTIFVEAYEVLRRIHLFRRREIYDSVKDYIMEMAENIIFDDAHTYNEFLAKIVAFIGLSSKAGIIIVTEKGRISKSPIAHTLKILREKGLMGEIELKPLDSTSIGAILREEFNQDFSDDVVEKFVKDSNGDINFIKFLAAGHTINIHDIDDRFSSLGYRELETLGFICLAYMPLTLIDLMHLSGRSLDEIMNILEKLSREFWICEMNGRFITSSKKMREFVEKKLTTEMKERIHRKLAYMYDWENMHVAAAHHYEFFDKKMAATHYRKEGEIAAEIHAYTSAIKYFRRAWEISGSMEDLYSIAKILLDVGDLKTVEEIAGKYRHDPRMACLLSIKNLLEGNVIEAIKSASSSEKYLSGNMKIYAKIAQALCLRQLGIYDASTEIAENTLKLSEEYDYTEGKAYSHFIIGTNLIEKKLDVALEHLAEAFELSRGTSLQYIVGIYYITSLSLAGRIEEAEKILKIMKREVRGRYSFYERQIVKFCEANLHYFRKDWSQFLAVSSDVLEFFEESEIKIYRVDLLMLLGDYYLNVLGDEKEALKYYNYAFLTARDMVNPRLLNASYKKVKNLIKKNIGDAEPIRRQPEAET